MPSGYQFPDDVDASPLSSLSQVNIGDKVTLGKEAGVVVQVARVANGRGADVCMCSVFIIQSQSLRVNVDAIVLQIHSEDSVCKLDERNVYRWQDARGAWLVGSKRIRGN
jgi:hypothetical protein